MAKLTAKARKAVPKSEFGLPEKAPGPGSYPMPDKPHARIAESYAERFASPAEKKRIDAKAQKVLHGADGGMIRDGYACGGKVKKADGGMVGGGNMMSCHNPDNRLPRQAMHVRGRNRGM